MRLLNTWCPTRIVGIVALVLFQLWAASNSTAQPAPQSGPEVWAYIQSLPPSQRTAVLAREAKREGGFTFYAVVGIDTIQMLQKAFNAKYPDVKIEYVRLTAAEAPQKVILEQRTRRVADAIFFGKELLDVMKPALAPYEPAAWDDLDKRFKSGSAKDNVAAATFFVTPTTIAWRTDRVSPSEAPKTIDDLTDPKWAGRLGTPAPILESFMDATELARGDKAADALFEKLAKQKPRVFASMGAASQALASGEFDVAFNFLLDRAKQLKDSGAPIDYVYAKPLYGAAVVVAPIKNSPKPYGAALFVDFLMSAEGSQAIDQLEKARVYGNTKGTYAIPVAKLSDLQPFEPLPVDRYTTLKAKAQNLFIR